MGRETASTRGVRPGSGYTGLALGVLLCLLAVVGVTLFSRQGLWEISRLRQELQRLERENARLAQENRRLALTIERLHHDPLLIQDQIRKQLNYIRKNELILHLPETQPPVTLPADRHKPPPPGRVEARSHSRGAPAPSSPPP